MDALCLVCDEPMELEGSCGIADWENRWEALADRWVCPNGHTTFVVMAEIPDGVEEDDNE